MLICYDKAFPEASRTLALDGGRGPVLLVGLARAARPARRRGLQDDRQWRRSELWDRSRAAENSLIVASANQTGSFGTLRFLGDARVVGPGGDLARRRHRPRAASAIATLDVSETVERARRALSPIRDLRPDVYATPAPMLAPETVDA